MKRRTGKGSTWNITLAGSIPELGIAVMVGVPGVARNPTVNDAVNTPELIVQSEGEAISCGSVAISWQVVSWSMKPVP